MVKGISGVEKFFEEDLVNEKKINLPLKLTLDSSLQHLIRTELIKAEEKIVFINMNYILNQSKAGKSLQIELEKIHKLNLQNLKNIEEELKKSETDLLSKKNILKKEEFDLQINQLRTEARKYQQTRTKLTNEISKKRNLGTEKLLSQIKPILAKYSENNNVDLILDKKNVIVGKTRLDITLIITEQLNQEVVKIDLN